MVPSLQGARSPPLPALPTRHCPASQPEHGRAGPCSTEQPEHLYRGGKSRSSGPLRQINSLILPPDANSQRSNGTQKRQDFTTNVWVSRCVRNFHKSIALFWRQSRGDGLIQTRSRITWEYHSTSSPPTCSIDRLNGARTPSLFEARPSRATCDSTALRAAKLSTSMDSCAHSRGIS